MSVSTSEKTFGLNVQTLNEDLSFAIGASYTSSKKYDSEYEVTPSDDILILPTAGRLLSENITINPIPNSYGRISWNGSILTVS